MFLLNYVPITLKLQVFTKNLHDNYLLIIFFSAYIFVFFLKIQSLESDESKLVEKMDEICEYCRDDKVFKLEFL